MNIAGVGADLGHDSFSPGILASKLMPPAEGTTQLARPHLVEAMLGAQTARLILIRAAGGFGKTTLMQQYATHCRALHRNVVWLRVDAADNDLTRFLLHLDAGARTLPGAPGGVSRTAAPGGLPSGLLERLAGCTQPFSILLDDFETIQNAAVLDFVQRMIEALPPLATLVISSRITPELGLGRIRARGELLDINPAALRFTLAESTAFIRDKCQLPLRDSEIATLHRCTEGWVTAIYLATLSLRTRSDHAAFVASFSGTNLELAEYLAEDILARQTGSCRAFLLDTSVLTQFSADLCNAVTNRQDSREMLDYLERSNLFLVPLDGERSWYRYHRLFASFLRHRLRAGEPHRERQLHVAAARWYLEADRPVPAIEHLLDAEELEEALDLIAQHASALLSAGRIRLMLRWLDKIPPAVLASNTRVGLTYAWVLLLNRRYADALQAVQRILTENEGNPDSESLALEAEAIRGVAFALTDQVEACRQACLATLNRLPPQAGFPYYSLANSLAYSLVTTHRYDEARSVLSRALQRTLDHPFIHMRSIAEALEGVIDLVQGRLGTALARFATASERNWNDDAGEMAGGATGIDGSRAQALYETDALDEVERRLTEVLAYAKANSPPDALITSHVLSARIAYLRGDKELWLRLLAELEQLGRAVKSDRLICSAWLERTRVATLEGRFEAAEQALRAATLHGDWETIDVSFNANDIDRPSIARCRLDIARGNHAAAAQVLQDAIEQAAARQRYWRVLKLRLLRALALDGMGEQVQSFSELTEALRMASHEGFLRSFLDEGQALARLIGLWAARHQAHAASLGIVPAFVERLIARIAEDQNGIARDNASADAAPGDQTDALTARELDVLRMLSAGHRNRVIAEKLFVSELTVKSHLRKINAKLGAENRTQAVAIARTKGLIP